MFTCYLTDQEFYAQHPIQQWILPENCTRALQSAALIVSDDLRRRGIDSGKLMAPTMLVGTTLYERVTKSSFTGGAVACSAASRLVIELDSAEFPSFGLQGSKDKATWRAVGSAIDANPLKVECAGAGVFSARFYVQYPYYQLTLNSDTDVVFTAYLVDDSASRMIELKAIEEAMVLVLDQGTRTQQLYDASRMEYSELIQSIKAAYDQDADGTPDTEISLQRNVLLHR
jgi:hypothetical protein